MSFRQQVTNKHLKLLQTHQDLPKAFSERFWKALRPHSKVPYYSRCSPMDPSDRKSKGQNEVLHVIKYSVNKLGLTVKYQHEMRNYKTPVPFMVRVLPPGSTLSLWVSPPRGTLNPLSLPCLSGYCQSPSSPCSLGQTAVYKPLIISKGGLGPAASAYLWDAPLQPQYPLWALNSACSLGFC
ncbi:hypothetical protein UY3_08067 [Chelonia mydas]|uniref:Uncharacterized protein n=1 Tax=Chelonia mydas TaxID=8469 RepID=M7B9Y9_CHEMY|nr:hypothetical protein UY3_08067 [Chelonia mydas]